MLLFQSSPKVILMRALAKSKRGISRKPVWTSLVAPNSSSQSLQFILVILLGESRGIICNGFESCFIMDLFVDRWIRFGVQQKRGQKCNGQTTALELHHRDFRCKHFPTTARTRCEHLIQSSAAFPTDPARRAGATHKNGHGTGSLEEDLHHSFWFSFPKTDASSAPCNAHARQLLHASIAGTRHKQSQHEVLKVEQLDHKMHIIRQTPNAIS